MESHTNIHLVLNYFTKKGQWYRIGRDPGDSMRFNSDNDTKQYQNWMQTPMLVAYLRHHCQML